MARFIELNRPLARVRNYSCARERMIRGAPLLTKDPAFVVKVARRAFNMRKINCDSPI